MGFASSFSHSVVCPRHLHRACCRRQVFNIDDVELTHVKFTQHALVSSLRTLCLALDSKAAFYFFLKSFVVLPFAFKSEISFELIFVPGVRFQSSVSFGFGLANGCLVPSGPFIEEATSLH